MTPPEPAERLIRGRTHRIGARIDTDLLAPGHAMKLPLAELARHCLEAIDPGFAARVRPGDVLAAGPHLGLGSSREQAAAALKQLGFACVVAPSVARIFYRNALNLGLPVLICPDAETLIEGETVEVDPVAGLVRRGDGSVLAAEPIPPHLLAMIADGGLLPHLARRFAAGRDAKAPPT